MKNLNLKKCLLSIFTALSVLIWNQQGKIADYREYVCERQKKMFIFSLVEISNYAQYNIFQKYNQICGGPGQLRTLRSP